MGSAGATAMQGSLSVNSHTRVSMDADPTYTTSTISGNVLFKDGAGNDDTVCVGACDKFRVTPSTGAVDIAGTTTVTGNLDVGGTKFQVTATNGNTDVFGSLTVGGAATLHGATTMEAAATVASESGSLSVGPDGATVFKVDTADDTMSITGDVVVTGDMTVNGDNLILGVTKTPSSASETCTQGHIAWDCSGDCYLYVCVQNNVWKRALMVSH